MERKDDVVKRSAALNLLEQAKEMEIFLKKVPIRINKNTVLLVTPEKLQRMGEVSQKKKKLSK